METVPISYVLVALALLASGWLLYVMTFAHRKRSRLRAFADEHGGTYELGASSLLRDRWQASQLAGDGMIGATVRLDWQDREVILFDVHPDPTGPARRTCLWMGWDEHHDNASPSLDTADLQHSPSPPTTLEAWQIELDVTSDGLLVASRDRALHDASEWRALVEWAEATLRSDPSPRPRDAH